jgi:hypothetical protein
MIQEEKELLLKDLCEKLPYGVKVQYEDKIFDIDYISPMYEEVKLNIADNYTIGVYEIKPYLFPLSSMTEEEVDEFTQFDVYGDGEYIIPNYETIDWLNAHHFDYRGLIEKGLAIEAPEGMYN